MSDLWETKMTPDPERVREALALVDDGYGVYDEVTPTLEIIIDAARAWLAGSSPDYQAAAKVLFGQSQTDEDQEFGELVEWDDLDVIVQGWWVASAVEAVDAALGIPGDET